MIEIRLGGHREPFEGPLDLLLALVRRGGYPLDQLPVAQLTREFLTCVEGLRAGLEAEPGDGEAAAALADALAEFAAAASWLVLLKSRALLPPDPAGESGAEEQETPEGELGRALLGHAALREAARLLGDRMEAAGLPAGAPLPGILSAAIPAATPEAAAPDRSAPPAEPTIADAVRSARRALDAIRARPQPDPYPMEVELAQLQTALTALPAGKAASTAPWFQTRPPEAQAALLLALLELARLGRILLHQPQEFGAVALKRIDG